MWNGLAEAMTDEFSQTPGGILRVRLSDEGPMGGGHAGKHHDWLFRIEQSFEMEQPHS